MALRKLSKMRTVNDGSRSLHESVMMPQIIDVLRDWSTASAGGALIGRLGHSFYARPQYTEDVDFLFLHPELIPARVTGFTRVRPEAFQHDATDVEVHLVTPCAINVSHEVAQKVEETTVCSDGIRIASASGLVALKLHRLSFQDKADIVALIKTGRIDISDFPLSPEKVDAYTQFVEEAKTDPHP